MTDTTKQTLLFGAVIAGAIILALITKDRHAE